MPPDSKAFIIKRADQEDAGLICDAHAASIRELGAQAYNPDIVALWGAKKDPESYRAAMADHGEVYFLARETTSHDSIMGFSSYRFEKGRHNLQSIYVRGTASRRGIGTALLKTVEDFARTNGAAELHVEGSLVAEPFYKAAGFTLLSRGQHPLRGSMLTIETVIMKKHLS
ncbi:MAG TPA: GNAT family N-acetyltransferase [Micavibrio sp.]|jgi:GNAT superfamily N-acetyltransferase